MLPDDILVSILGRVDIRTAARTSALSTRWRNLPWLLPELDFDVKDFLPVPKPNPIEVSNMEDAMASITKATSSFLAKPQSESSTVTRLHINFYLISHFSCDIGSLLGDAIDNSMLKGLDLVILDEKEPPYCLDVEMVQQAEYVNGFFTAYPSVLICLTKLSLYNVCFRKWDIHHVLFDCCNQLKHIALFHCDAGHRSVWKIDTPNTKLHVLQLYSCFFEKLEIVCLPKLEKLHWNTWTSHNSPLSFGFVPSLRELHLLCGATQNHKGFNLSELLCGTSDIHTLTLDFQGEKLWMHPEMKQLRTTFNKLRKLSVHGIFVEFDLVWTTAFLQVAPSIEILHILVIFLCYILVWEHACEVDSEARQMTFPERTNPCWEPLKLDGSKNLLLKELQLVGFRPLEQQITFIRAVLERAPNLKSVFLKEDSEPCEDCDALGILPCSLTGHVFPKNKGDQDAVVKKITNGIVSFAQIIFGS
ncbi:hypothetical protein BAE44_0004365 [Dichanthelium oligosanthes]|uniref:F-box domain-containing protein n=1 Tax=Dichanthelium oligosanthes TaxID=888268 RepID=A0A1E5WB75_9POAL|nr:hypothetical protein BAE44_0004365 [Dichanthelium oligosanthes]